MSPLMALWEIFLYCTQQLGIMLGVGAQTVLVVMYLVASRDRVIDKEEAKFLSATKQVVYASLVLVILSGICVTLATPREISMQPGYLFKWILILLVAAFAILDYQSTSINDRFKGLAVGSWYALFAVHILAPVTTWMLLGAVYGVWMIGFMICWIGLTFAIHGKPHRKSVAPIPPPARAVAQIPIPPATKLVPPAPIKPIPTAPPTPAAIVPTPPPAKPEVAAPPMSEEFVYQDVTTGTSPMLHPHLTSEVSATPIPAAPMPSSMIPKVEGSNLPAVRVMPKTPEEVAAQLRPPVIQYT